jgi:hypothetical protein
MSVKDELEGMCEETVVFNFKAIPQHFSGGTEIQTSSGYLIPNQVPPESEALTLCQHTWYILCLVLFNAVLKVANTV